MPELGNTDDNEFGGASQQSGSFGSPPDPDEDPLESAAETGSDSVSEGNEPVNTPPSAENQSGSDGDSEDLSAEDEVSIETFQKFGKTYRISEEDAGYSPWEIFQDLKQGEDRDPNEMDKEILDDLMMEGYYERSFEIGNSSFRVRTVGPKTRHHAVHALNEMLDQDRVTPAMRNMLIVAEQLSSFNGESTVQSAPSVDFESKSSVQARIRFCQDLATPILDAVGSRVNAFRDRVNTATSRSVSNF